MFFVLEIIVEYILIPQADSKRRDDFIDNAFGSTFSPSPSVGYYDTDEVQKGLYKAACNLFENSFFTYSLAKIITVRKMQALFSATLLGDLVKHMILLTRLHTIHDAWISLFQHSDLKSNTGKYQAIIYRHWLQYEALHSSIPAGIPDKVFRQHDTKLTKEWFNLKNRYNIN